MKPTSENVRAYAKPIRQAKDALNKIIKEEFKPIRKNSGNNWGGKSGKLMIQLFDKNINELDKITCVLESIACDIENAANTFTKK
ncbi:MAG: hypothetical protein ABF289_03665 [Clostridiales bacterium]